MIVLLTCKNEEDPIKNDGVRVLTRLYKDYTDTEGHLTSQSVVESGGIDLIRALMVVIVTC